MSKVKIQGHASGSGVLTLTAPNTSTDRTITLPDTTGTLLDENSSVPAANLTGTVADARISALAASKLTGALPAISAANLTAIPAANITGTLPAISGANLTGISSAAGSSYFQAKFSSNAWNSYAGGNKIGFNSVHYNVGSDYDETNNRYVAPADGVYYFHFSLYTALNDASNGFVYRKNGSANNIQDNANSTSSFNEEGSGDKTLHANLVVQLDQNEYVEIYSTTQSDLYTGHSSWGGFRIA